MKIILCTSLNAPEVYVMSLDQVVSKLPMVSGFNVISIRDTRPGTNIEKYQAIDRAGIQDIMQVQFDDLWSEEHREYGSLPQGQQIFSVLEWAKKKWQENRKPFIVHCTAGISRSSAVAVLLDAMFRNSKEAVDRFDATKHSPNQMILEIGENYLKTPGLTQEVKKKEENTPSPLLGNIF